MVDEEDKMGFCLEFATPEPSSGGADHAIEIGRDGLPDTNGLDMKQEGQEALTDHETTSTDQDGGR